MAEKFGKILADDDGMLEDEEMLKGVAGGDPCMGIACSWSFAEGDKGVAGGGPDVACYDRRGFGIIEQYYD